VVVVVAQKSIQVVVDRIAANWNTVLRMAFVSNDRRVSI